MKQIRSTLAVLFAVMLLSGHVFADEVVDGRFGPGALYRLVRPTNWNGTLLLYAHGAVPRSAPIALPPEADLIINLLAPQGFAVAFSSFSENGWAVKDGAQRTHQLLGIFTSKFGSPTRVLIGGASMGGLITIKLVEQYRGTFAGALAACAVAGGARKQFDYCANVRALFDFFYPGILPGNAGAVPSGIDITTAIIQPAIAAMQNNPAGAFAIASINQTPVPFSSPAELLESVVTALAGNAGSYNDLVPELHGKPYFDNRNVQYTGALPASLLAAINANVGRFGASPSALNYMNQYYNPAGSLQIPMVMLSTSRDPVVPGFHQTSYSNIVAASGHSDMLLQRSINRYGHCVFTPAELATAITDLVVWVALGIKPSSSAVRGGDSYLTSWKGDGQAERQQEDTPTSFRLEQNFPNPFNPTTTIEYALPTDARVTLEVYDVLGRRVADLVNGHISAGYHSVEFSATSLASGIYFYRMNATGAEGKTFTQMRKLILMK